MATAGAQRLAAGGERFELVLRDPGSALALDAVRLAPESVLDLTDALHDSLLFVHEGRGTLSGNAVDGQTALLVPATDRAILASGEDHLAAVRATVGAATDLHAPMGLLEPVVALAAVEPGQATGARSFQLLHGPHNGSVRATSFMGYIPPGRAPWHYHLYDEIVWVLRGEGRLHVGDTVEPLASGSAFRLHAREVHIVENTQPVEELAVLGIFTPAGSPSAAYLTADVAEAYVFSG